jgi:hypothetical protein
MDQLISALQKMPEVYIGMTKVDPVLSWDTIRPRGFARWWLIRKIVILEALKISANGIPSGQTLKNFFCKEDFSWKIK